MLLLKDSDPLAPGGMAASFEAGKRYAAEATALLADERAAELANVLQLTPTRDCPPDEEARARFTPLKLEFEKCYWPYLLVAKKIYCAGKYEQPDAAPKVEVKGLQLARRTVAEVVRAGQQRALDCLMNNRDPVAARDEALRTARAMLAGEGGNLATYEFSKKLNTVYLQTATLLGPKQRASGKNPQVQVSFDGRWRVSSDHPQDWSKLLGSAAPPRPGATLECKREAYRPWTLLDAAGEPVGTVAMHHEHVHVALRQEEEARGKGPRPGDRVRYVCLNRAHNRAEKGARAPYAFAYAPETARLRT